MCHNLLHQCRLSTDFHSSRLAVETFLHWHHASMLLAPFAFGAASIEPSCSGPALTFLMASFKDCLVVVGVAVQNEGELRPQSPASRESAAVQSELDMETSVSFQVYDAEPQL